MNEGHAAFLQLERIRELVQDHGLPPDAALWACPLQRAVHDAHAGARRATTPSRYDLMDRFFGDYWGRMGMDRERFLTLGAYD